MTWKDKLEIALRDAPRKDNFPANQVSGPQVVKRTWPVARRLIAGTGETDRRLAVRDGDDEGRFVHARIPQHGEFFAAHGKSRASGGRIFSKRRLSRHFLLRSMALRLPS